MAQFKRRDFLKAGIAGILVARQAPAFAQQGTVHWIKWNDFVPASDELLRKSMVPEAMKALGVKITLETVNGNDLQPRVTSAIQSGAGPDIFMPVSYTHLRAHETPEHLVCRLLLEKKKKKAQTSGNDMHQ